MEESALRAMDAEQLREHAHKMVDFISDYYKTIQNFPVLSQVQVLHSPPSLRINAFLELILRTCCFITLFLQFQPGYLGNLLPDSAPEYPDSLQNVLDGETSYFDSQLPFFV